MAQVKATKPMMENGRKLTSLHINVESNGFTVCKEFEPKEGKNGPIWEPSRNKDRMVFTSAKECAEYIEDCLGAGAEKGEEKPGKGGKEYSS